MKEIKIKNEIIEKIKLGKITQIILNDNLDDKEEIILSCDSDSIKVEITGKAKYKKGTINTSQVEKEYLKQLRKIYGYPDVMTQYKSEKYPFRCDFYIRSLDLYIELNVHWTHGGMPYDKNNPECQKKLELWKEKAKTSKFYDLYMNC